MDRGSARGVRSLRATLVAFVLVAMTAATGRAQLARVVTSPPTAAKLMVVPFARDSADSTLAVAIPDGVRDRLRLTRAEIFNIILKAGMNEALEASGYNKDMPLEPSVARQLARFLNVRILVEGNIIRTAGDSLLVVARLAETQGLAPQSASASLTVPRLRANATTGSDLANRLADAYRSFEYVTNCRRGVDSLANARNTADSTRLLTRAQQAADRALQQYPNSAGAHLCMAMMRRSQGATSDTILSHLRMAEDLDSLNALVLRQLARVYEERGDTAELLHMTHHVLKVEVRNDTLRVNAARLWVMRGQPDSALVLIDEGLAGSPSNVTLLNARSIALAAGRRWEEAARTLSLVAEVDSTNIDSLLVYRITNYYQQVPDTANLLLWTRIATVRMATQAQYHFNLAALLAARGDTANALAAIRHYLELRPNDGRAMLTLAVWISGSQPDSALAWASRSVAADTTLRPSAAGIYLRRGAAIFSDTTIAGAVRWARTDSILGIAQPWATARTLANIGYIRGLAELQLASLAAQDAQANRNCDAVRRAGDLVSQVETNIVVGVSINREQANQILSQYVPQLRTSLTGLQRQLHCP